MKRANLLLGVLALGVSSTSAFAWDAHGHRTVTLLAVDRFESTLTASKEPAKKAEAPAELAFVFTPEGRAQAAYQSGEPDRFRAIRSPHLKHENDLEHYLDIEDLKPYGLTLSTIPPLRYEFLRTMAIARDKHPEDFRPYNPMTDPAKTQEWPGFLPYAMSEHYWKLVSSFRQIRVLSHLKDPERSNQVAAARANVIYEMGILSHFVGDAAQPLHTTEHHHGWIGENPDGFTTNRGFHAYIDGTIVATHHLNHDTLKAACSATRTVDKNDPFKDILSHIQRSYDYVRPLYQLQKTGDLEKEPGKAFISERLCDGAGMLGAMYAAAWEMSAMSTQDVGDFVKYDSTGKDAPNPMVEEEKRLKRQGGK